VWNGGYYKEHMQLASCHYKSLQLAVENGCKTVAFPDIIANDDDYPKQEAAEIAIRTVTEFLSKNKRIEKVIFCCSDDDNYQIMNDLFQKS
jgi:O-acetyl-ADP-ribose deacetylase (regulator of RNase III)